MEEYANCVSSFLSEVFYLVEEIEEWEQAEMADPETLHSYPGAEDGRVLVSAQQAYQYRYGAMS